MFPETLTVTVGFGGITLPPFLLAQPAMQIASTAIRMLFVRMVSSFESDLRSITFKDYLRRNPCVV